MNDAAPLMRWDASTRTLSLRLPHWTDVLARLRHRRVAKFIAFVIVLDLLMAWVDLPLSEFMRGLDPALISFFGVITDVGDSRYWLVPSALLLPFLLAARQAVSEGSLRRTLGWVASAVGFFFVAVAGSGLSVDVLKALFGRARPRLWVEEDLYGFAPFNFYDSDYTSFPSGHATTVFAVAMAVACFVPRWRKALMLLALPFALSRVVLTKHYLSDVIAGGVFGTFFVMWLRDFYSRRGWVFIRQNGQIRLRAPGQLLASKLRLLFFGTMGLPDGPRGKLP